MPAEKSGARRVKKIGWCDTPYCEYYNELHATRVKELLGEIIVNIQIVVLIDHG